MMTPGVGGHHAAGHFLRTDKGALEIGVKHRIPRLFRELEEGTRGKMPALFTSTSIGPSSARRRHQPPDIAECETSAWITQQRRPGR